MSPATKKQKVARHQEAGDEDEDVSMGEQADDSENDASEEGLTSSDDTNTDTEIALAQQTKKSKKTSKRKRRAVSPTPFARALNILLDTSAPTTQPLSLKPAVARQKNEEKLEMRAKKLLIGERKEKEDKGRVKDVIGGWGGESERALRKVAQRGVVKLFNVIQQAQSATVEVQAETKASRGKGKPSLPAPKADDFGTKPKLTKKNATRKDNIIGRGKEVTLAQDDFMDLIRSGGVVSKT